jgi:hypothetical protein
LGNRDLREYASGTNRRLIAGLIVIALTVGGALIYVFYGREAWLLGIFCIAISLLSLLLIWGALILLGKIADRYGGA